MCTSVTVHSSENENDEEELGFDIDIIWAENVHD